MHSLWLSGLPLPAQILSVTLASSKNFHYGRPYTFKAMIRPEARLLPLVCLFNLSITNNLFE